MMCLKSIFPSPWRPRRRRQPRYCHMVDVIKLIIWTFLFQKSLRYRRSFRDETVCTTVLEPYFYNRYAKTINCTLFGGNNVWRCSTASGLYHKHNSFSFASCLTTHDDWMINNILQMGKVQWLRNKRRKILCKTDEITKNYFCSFFRTSLNYGIMRNIILSSSAFDVFDYIICFYRLCWERLSFQHRWNRVRNIR